MSYGYALAFRDFLEQHFQERRQNLVHNRIIIFVLLLKDSNFSCFWWWRIKARICIKTLIIVIFVLVNMLHISLKVIGFLVLPIIYLYQMEMLKWTSCILKNHQFLWVASKREYMLVSSWTHLGCLRPSK